MRRTRLMIVCFCLALLVTGCDGRTGATAPTVSAKAPQRALIADTASPEGRRLAQAAQAQVGRTVTYDPSYVTLAYPKGDVPMDRGVCSDVVIRAFREMGVDLQVLIHEDMERAFSKYPRLWSLDKPDPNIDHRRVPNLRVFFKRAGKALPITKDPADYQPGDVVTWNLRDGGLPHTGIVSTVRAPGGDRFCVVHNIGSGTRIEDRLFDFTITGHYRWW